MICPLLLGEFNRRMVVLMHTHVVMRQGGRARYAAVASARMRHGCRLLLISPTKEVNEDSGEGDQCYGDGDADTGTHCRGVAG
jgi:hypothetical protein